MHVVLTWAAGSEISSRDAHVGGQRLERADLSTEQIEIARKEFPQVEQMALTEELQTAPPAAYEPGIEH
jgi:hypothetical protein